MLSSHTFKFCLLLFFCQSVMKLLVNEVDRKKSGVMVPIPQYPLYSATLAEFNMHQVCVLVFCPMMLRSGVNSHPTPLHKRCDHTCVGNVTPSCENTSPLIKY
jgi:hypothetical protein